MGIGVPGHLMGLERLDLVQHAQTSGLPSALSGHGLWHPQYRLLQVDLGGAGDIGDVGDLRPIQFIPQPGALPVHVVAGHGCKGQAPGLDVLDHLPAQLDLGLKLALGRDTDPLPRLGHLGGEPVLLQIQFPVHPSPHRPSDLGRVGVAQEGAHLTHLHLAQATIVLTPGPRLLVSSLVGTLIQDQHAAPLQARRGFDLLYHLIQAGPRRPRRVRHEVLDIFRRHPRGTPNVGIVAVGLQAQQTAQIVIGISAGVAGPGLEAVRIALPKAVQTLRQLLAEFGRQPPALGDEHCIVRRALRTSGQLLRLCVLLVLPRRRGSRTRGPLLTSMTSATTTSTTGVGPRAGAGPLLVGLVDHQIGQRLYRQPSLPAGHPGRWQRAGDTDSPLAYPHDQEYNDPQAVAHGRPPFPEMLPASVTAFV